MGLLDMSRSEAMLHVKFITEAAKLRGQACLLYQVDKSTSDLHNDKDIIYKDPVLVNVLFDDSPKTILKKMNWFNEDEDLPYVVYLTHMDKNYSDIRVTKDCLIEMKSIQVEQAECTRFIISDVKGNSINPVYWTCKLVPYRPKSEMKEVQDYEAPNNTDMGYSFIRRGDPS